MGEQTLGVNGLSSRPRRANNKQLWFLSLTDLINETYIFCFSVPSIRLDSVPMELTDSNGFLKSFSTFIMQGRKVLIMHFLYRGISST